MRTKKRSIHVKTCPSTTLFITDSPWVGLRLALASAFERTAINCLTYGKAVKLLRGQNTFSFSFCSFCESVTVSCDVLELNVSLSRPLMYTGEYTSAEHEHNSRWVVNGHRHSHLLFPGKLPSAPIWQEGEWVQETVWTFKEKIKISCSSRAWNSGSSSP
jgi:hypothetical protein